MLYLCKTLAIIAFPTWLCHIAWELVFYIAQHCMLYLAINYPSELYTGLSLHQLPAVWLKWSLKTCLPQIFAKTRICPFSVSTLTYFLFIHSGFHNIYCNTPVHLVYHLEINCILAAGPSLTIDYFPPSSSLWFIPVMLVFN